MWNNEQILCGIMNKRFKTRAASGREVMGP